MAGERTSDVHAAGVVAFRPGRELLLVHRPRYDDWSFPKGKLDRGEHAVVAAVREVHEETGLLVRLGRPLTDQCYPVGGRSKVVHYWVARVVGSDDVTSYVPNAEIDDVRWVAADEAVHRLTYDHDRDTLAEALRNRSRTHAVVVLRHAETRPREDWAGADADRPLLPEGHDTAAALAPLLAAYDTAAVLSSSSLRCVQTVQPFADAAGRELETRRSLSEADATASRVRRIVGDAVDGPRGTVLCTHRPVLPLVFAALGLAPIALERGELVVAHVRQGDVVAVERHLPR